MNGFQANPEGLMDKGKRITEIYNNYMVEKQNVDKTADEIAAAWSGADAAGYITQIHSYDADFKKLGEVLAQIGDILYRHGSRLASSRDTITQIASRL